MPEQTSKRASGAGGVAQLARLLAQGGLGGRGRRSSLTRWLRTHHDAFAALLATQEPSWDELAAALAGMGLLDGAGKAPAGERVRKAWWAVRRAKAAAAAGRAARLAPPALSPGEIAPAVFAAPVPGGTDGGRSRLRMNLQPARPLDETKTGSLATSPAPVPAPAPAMSSAVRHPSGLLAEGQPVSPEPSLSDRTATDQVQELLAQMAAGRVKLPKVVT